MIDLKELEKGMDLTRKEMENRAKDKSKQSPTLQDFVAKAGEMVSKLRQDGDAAQVMTMTRQFFFFLKKHSLWFGRLKLKEVTIYYKNSF